MVKQQLRVLCFINYSHLPSSGGEGATFAHKAKADFECDLTSSI